MKYLVQISCVLLAVACLSACGGGDSLPGNEALESAFAQGRSGVWLSGHGSVVRELGGDEATQRFQLRISDALTVILVHQVGRNGRIPAQRGDVLSFHGRYDFHGAGGELGMTHADPAQPGGGGWVSHGGQRYD